MCTYREWINCLIYNKAIDGEAQQELHEATVNRTYGINKFQVS